MRISTKDLRTAVNALNNRTKGDYDIQSYLGQYRLIQKKKGFDSDVSALMPVKELYSWVNALLKGIDTAPTVPVLLYTYEAVNGETVYDAIHYTEDYASAVYKLREMFKNSATPLLTVFPAIHESDKDTIIALLENILKLTPASKTGQKHNLETAIALIQLHS